MECIGPYTLKSKDKTHIDFMFITIFDQATSWFEIVELLVLQHRLNIPKGTKGQQGIDTYIQSKQPYFDKTSTKVGNIITGPGLVITHVANTLSTITEVSLNSTLRPSVIYMSNA